MCCYDGEGCTLWCSGPDLTPDRVASRASEHEGVVLSNTASYSIILAGPNVRPRCPIALPFHRNRTKIAFSRACEKIGRAYQNQALELISICHELLPRITLPKFAHEDAELSR